MNHPFDLDNFESFLSEQADQHRMYASDGVWRRIQENLHGKDRWPALTFGAILTTAVIAVVLTFTYPQKSLYNSPADYSGIAKANTFVAGPKASVKSKAETEPARLVAPVELKPVSNASIPDGDGVETALAANEQEQDSQTGILPGTGLNNEGNQIITGSVVSLETHAGQQKMPGVQAEELSIAQNQLHSTNWNQANVLRSEGTELLIRPLESSPKTGEMNALSMSNAGVKHENILQDNFLKTSMSYGPKKPGKSISGKSRWLMQWYATPSISYRYMLQDKKFEEDPTGANGPLAPYLTNPARDFVQHKPKLGLEAGTAFIYKLTENFRVKTGLQVNYRQFGILAYATNAQPAMLTLNRENGIDSIIRFSSISTQSGIKSMNLSSNFLQLAIPLGFDMKIADTRSVDFYVSASGQLTYQLASSYYILSDDYKNYLKQPGIDRKFNINTAVEAFASFDAGGVTWQAGPQIRYQLLPGSIEAYPIREHLIDYGFKVGVVKKLK